MARTVYKRSANGAKQRSPNGAFIANVTDEVSDIAYVDSGNDDLRVYHWDESSGWSQTGNDLSSFGLGHLAAVTESVIIDSGGEIADQFTSFKFDGTDWSQVDTEDILNESNDLPRCTALLSGERVAYGFTEGGGLFPEVGIFACSPTGQISGVGPRLSIANTPAEMIAVSNRTFAAVISGASSLQSYNYNGKAIEAVGSAYSLSGYAGGDSSICGIAPNRAAYFTEDDAAIVILGWTGSQWSEITRSPVLLTPDAGFIVSITALTENHIALCYSDNSNNSTLQVYDMANGFAQVGADFVISSGDGVQVVIASLNVHKRASELSIASISPETGDTAGGTSITVTGTNFTNDTTVEFDGNQASSIVLNSSAQITCSTPSGSSGVVDVSVVDGTDEYFLEDAYTYGGFSVDSVTPSSGTSAGGTSVTITGEGFIGPAVVAFGPNSATNVTVVNSTTITCDTPAGTGTVDVGVLDIGASDNDTLTNGFTYT